MAPRPLALALAAAAAFAATGAARTARAEDGYELWLRYRPLADGARRDEYRRALSGLAMEAPTPTLRAARDELRRGLSGLLERELPAAAATAREGLQLSWAGERKCRHVRSRPSRRLTSARQPSSRSILAQSK
jgi:alpha-glucuronidase